MKKTMYLCTLVLLALFGSQRASAQHITTHYFFDSCATGSGFYVSCSGATSGLMLEASFGDGTVVSTGISSGYVSFSHSYSSAGTYTIKYVLYSTSGGRVDSISYSQLVEGCQYITGRMYDDVNSNCSYDAGDHIIWYPIAVQVDSAGTHIDTIYSYGSFIYKAASTSTTYTFTPINIPSSITLACPSGGSRSCTASFGTVVSVGDFGFHCSTSTSFDLAVHLVTHTGRHSNTVMVTVTNNSCTTKSGTLTLIMDSKYTYGASNPTATTATGHTLTWNFSNLSIDSSATFCANEETYPWLTIGTSVVNSAYITHVTGDANSADDSVTNNDTVTASWDPNDKQVMPQGNVASGTRLTYTLSFENTGNAPAANIHILDTLSSYLDPKTIQIVSSSHHTLPLLLHGPAGTTILKFDFPNINLLDSSHHGQADGYVTFSINTATGLSNGTLINNRAGIYFDDNPVVMTNLVTNTIHTTAVPTVNNNNQVSVYPNPANNELTINTGNSKYDEVIIMNNLGQTILQQQMQSSLTHINIASLTPGMYYIMLKGANGIQVEKVEKQ